jgi:hypothetical protein
MRGQSELVRSGSDPLSLTEDASMNLTRKALNTISSYKMIREKSHRDRIHLGKRTSPDLHYQNNSPLGFGFENERRGGDGFIPPWAYKMHRMSSISGWYSALPLDDSLLLTGGDGS